MVRKNRVPKEYQMKFIVLLGRIFYSAIFLLSCPKHFTQPLIDFAASQGTPFASIVVPLSGLIGILGALSILLGYKAKLGAWLIVIFLVPITLVIHKFWAYSDPNMANLQLIMFMKNLSMLGGALLITHFGSGPLSLDKKKKK